MLWPECQVAWCNGDEHAGEHLHTTAHKSDVSHINLVAIYHHRCTQINADMLSNDVTRTSMTGDCSKVFTSTTEESSRHTR